MTQEVQFQQNPMHIVQLSDTVYGKPTKNRGQEPTMFQLLTWENDSLNRKDFKKNQAFKKVSQAYLQQIERQPWTSESKENYVRHDGCVPLNEGTLYKVENYIYQKQGKKERQIRESQQNQQTNNNNSPQPTLRKQVSTSQGNLEQNNRSYQNIRRTNSPELGSNNKEKINRANSPQPNLAKNRAPTYKKNAFGYNEEDHKQVTQQEELKQNQKLIEKFKQTTRWIPNSAFTTYFGKPPFENYGYGNVKPTKGGLIYGTYLYSHNVHPHRGMNSPKSIQSYPVALSKAKSQGTLVPYPPKTKNPHLNTSAEGNDHSKKFTNIDIYPEPNLVGKLDIEIPNLNDIEKFGGSGYARSFVNRPTQQNISDIKKAKKKSSQKKKVNQPNQRDYYEDWITLKEQQKGLRPATADTQKPLSRKVQY